MFRLPPLFADVVLDGFAIATIADCPDVVPISPELSTPEFGFHLGKLEAGFGGEGFDETNDLASGVFWEELAEDMDVVLVESNVMDIDGEAFF